MRFLFSGCVLFLSLLVPTTDSRAELFEDGETVCFLGDSITAGGRYYSMIADYYLTRFPDRTVRFVNAGRSGDTAGGALKRLKEDVIDKKPTTVAIMFGMNDVSRGSYVANPDEAKLKRQLQALERYKANMETLVARIREEADDPKLIFMTPSPFDQTVELERENQPGCNDGLGRCAEIVRELAAKNNGKVVDFHGPMTALNLEQQKKDPTWTIIGRDRVHPGAAGHLVMAWLFLKSQGAPALVSNIAVDAEAGEVAKSENAEVTKVEKKNEGVAFSILEKALPFPTDPGAKEVLELLPIATDLNQQILSVAGLVDGNYKLQIAGEEVGEYSAKQMEEGINLAFNKSTPQFKHAKEVAKLNEKRRNAEAQACSLINTRRWMVSYYKVDVDDPAAVQAHYDHFEDKKQYSAAMALRYIKLWPEYDDLRKQAADFEKQAQSSREPKQYDYLIVPVQ